MNVSLLTAEQFAEQKDHLPDGGRWAELVAGRVVTLEPPDDAHGTTVLNLSKAIASHMGRPQSADEGYACFDVGLIVARDPDTVRAPAMSWFNRGERFSEADKTITDTTPALVVEVASTNDRRRDVRRRVEEYHAWGVQMVWVIDPPETQVHVCPRGSRARQVSEHETLIGTPILAGFRIPVSDLFAVPSWWGR